MPIRLFVGVAANGEDAESQSVLEYTLHKHASEPVELVWMMLSRDRASFWSGWNSSSWHTPFSSFRWGIPAYCGFEGRAIYTDSDVIFCADIAELWNQPIPEPAFALVRGGEGKLRTCVILMDCARARQHIPPLRVLKGQENAHGSMTKYLKENRHLLGEFEGQWNCIDLKRTELGDPTLKLIHYSQMAHQPHLKFAKPRLAKQGRAHWYKGQTGPHWRPELETYFDTLLSEAIAAGYPPEKYEPLKPYGEYRKRSHEWRALKVETA